MVAVVVDDDTGNRRLVSRILGLLQIGVVEFASGDAAVAGLPGLRDDVSIVVTDVHMPGTLDGLALATRLGASDPPVSVIVMSGSDASLSAAASIAGVVGVLRKPFLPAELEQMTRAALALGATR